MPASIVKKPSDRERAYIAASRRSDRSVEARVESARRASEIHQRRTGKSLKVTEKDVLAEEMYEEEDDELPAQYRNLNAHLQTGSSDFDARLQAYLANAVAFRKALTGVAKNRDKSQNVDFVHTRQLADHEALFPKHSDAWKDIIIPKSSETSTSPFVPQGTPSQDTKRGASNPYDPRSSSLSNRRMSATQQQGIKMDSMGTLRPSDLKSRVGTYRPSSRHPSLPQANKDRQQTSSPSEQIKSAGINYDNLDQSSLRLANNQSTMKQGQVTTSPFSSKLPANAADMLMPVYRPRPDDDLSPNHLHLFDASLFHPAPHNTIDATLLAPTSYKTAPVTTNEYAPQSMTNNWQYNNVKDTSASRKLVEDNMWGTFINDTSTEAWDWINAP
ncbi:Putative uncharacterized protein [Taphrina deformans PYCC 5710]|uniref:Uncharacterized protein n=1 Tax=Taphrina deformans (strain PYCC 5710 / ATCC 11124 / CBS 356.35 / IMI 108563 / JCM 9778 / NBRC 8474) TaxID=1097556 RepID=R4X9I9_TAPDE|nr:Putative uncharacterized protein [Taphrina deformans PYCC 5710]|eukprot:CCG80894.1 Putative uncharacterized protein [Taphrina deformans PYCC 5710]